MMKKTYISPECEIIGIQNDMILTDSLTGVTGGGAGDGIGYGGVAPDGSMDPSSISWSQDNWDTLDD